ncbi:MAG: SDR family oxidoreductase [Gammaproteobacteria bacterium]|nr:SDR family oxidoreductase [Gammaproteobacteria bacterium]
MAGVALITGAAGGLGQALCRRFGESGYRVIGLDRVHGAAGCEAFVEADLEALCASPGGLGSVLERIRGLVSTMTKQDGGHVKPGLAVLVNNAACQVLGPVEALSVADWQRSLCVNLLAPFLLIQGLLPELMRARGSVINITSVHAKVTKPGFCCYATSKAALEGMTRSMATELGTRVRVNAIAPAAFATPMLEAGFAGRDEARRQLGEMHPIGRIGQPEEIAECALFLASPRAGFINGAVLRVDGGISSRLHDPL